MRFHTALGARMQLSPKEVRRAFSGITVAVRPCRALVGGKAYAFIVSECGVDGHIREQILAEDKAQVRAACRHFMRWLDKMNANYIKAADKSRHRDGRKENKRGN